MRTIGVVTVGRSDLGLYTPVINRILENERLELLLFVSGTHLSPEFGQTVTEIEARGWPIAARVEMSLSSDSPQGIAKSMGLGVASFAQVFSQARPDILLVLGDRFEMLAAVVAALPFNLPIAHIHGGETTQGAIDEAIRHSITKMSHLHFASTEEYGRRIIQMGEEPWRVQVTGSPAIDNIIHTPVLPREQVEARLSIRLTDPVLLVTYHPVTLEYQRAAHQARELLEAIGRFDCSMVVTYPNADTSGRAIIKAIKDFVTEAPERRIAVHNLGSSMYYSLMSMASAMLGNSSSGLIEAPSFRLPAVNVGSRQKGRIRAANVIDTGYGADEIEKALRTALSSGFRDSLRDLQNPYGDGDASERIVKALAGVQVDDRLIMKCFHDMPAPEAFTMARHDFSRGVL